MATYFYDRWLRWLLLISIAATFGCAAVPKESVDLSTKIGNGISESRRSHLNLLNLYFSTKRSYLDRWIAEEYTPKFLANVQGNLKKAGLPETLTPQQQKDVVVTIIKERDAWQAELEKTRVYIYEYLDGHYETLALANEGVTALLRSAVSVKDATGKLTETLSNATGGKVDLDKIEKSFDAHLLKAGEVAGNATNFYDEVTSAIKSQGGKQ